MPSRSNATTTSSWSMVGFDDGAGAAVLDELARTEPVEAAFVAARDDFVADHELPARDHERFAGQFAVRFEQRAGAVVEGAAGRVRAGDHRIDPIVQTGGVPVGDDRVEGLPRRS